MRYVPVESQRKCSSPFCSLVFPPVVGCSLLPARQLRLLQVGEQQGSPRWAHPIVEAWRVLLHPLWTAGSSVHCWGQITCSLIEAELIRTFIKTLAHVTAWKLRLLLWNKVVVYLFWFFFSGPHIYQEVMDTKIDLKKKKSRVLISQVIKYKINDDVALDVLSD